MISAFNILIPLLAGLLVYRHFRPDAIVSRFLCDLLGPTAELPAYLPASLISFCRNYTCDILWAYSLAFSIALALQLDQTHSGWIILICVSFETVLEVIQMTGVSLGTFDILDIVFEALSTIAAVYNYKNIKKKKKK